MNSVLSRRVVLFFRIGYQSSCDVCDKLHVP